MPNSQPNPNKKPDENQNATRNYPVANQPTGQEWRVIEKTLLASVEEQRRARRWGIFFKLLTFGYIIILFLLLGRGCSTASNTGLEGLDTSQPHLAVVDLEGVISSEDAANAYDVGEALTRAFENPNSKAVALNINSPGGSPVQSDEIWQTMMSLKEEYPDKKLYAVIGDIGASGAYYVASAADEIWVNPSSLVGSIGVIMQSYNIEGLLEKFGVQDRTITSGEYKDILSMTRELTPYEQEHVQSVLDNTHQHFIDAVKQGRGERLQNAEENQVFTGLFWSGEQSIELGLADKAGSIQSLEKELDLEYAVNYTPVDPMELFFERFAVKLGAGIGSTLKLDVAPEEKDAASMR